LRGSHSRATLSKLKNNNLDMPSATLWLLDGSLVHEEDLTFFAQQLSTSESRRYACFKRRERQRQFLLGRMLLRFAVSNLIALPLDALAVIERESNGPQLVLSNVSYLQPAFSISHSRNWVACAISFNVSLGVDIEVESPARDIIGISQSAFHPKDHGWLLRQPGTARLSSFYQLWCTREALDKLMSALGRETVLLPLVGEDGQFASPGDGWYCYSVKHFGLALAICSDRPLSALWRIEIAGLSRADWLAADREFRSTSVTTLPHEASKAEKQRGCQLVSRLI
jgi:4'-phosphopantetheinyl transferase